MKNIQEMRSASAAVLALILILGVLPARAAMPGLDQVLSAVTLSFGGDGSTDRAVLAENRDAGADLYLYLGLDETKPDAAAAPALVKKAAAWTGAMWGTRPSLEAGPKGALRIKSANDAIGRSRWSKVLTVVYRNKDFFVAGLTYESHDTLDPKAHGACDLNLLTGTGTRNGKPVKFAPAAPKLSAWDDDAMPRDCVF